MVQRKSKFSFRDNTTTGESDFIYSESTLNQESELHTDNSIADLSSSDEAADDQSPIFSCAYCRCSEARSIVRCRTTNRWFCNNSFTSTSSHIIAHITQSTHSALSLHPDSDFGEKQIVCDVDTCNEDNIFSLTANISVIVENREGGEEKEKKVQFRCKNHNTENFPPIVVNKKIQGILAPSAEESLEKCLLTNDIQIAVLEKEWQRGVSIEVEDLSTVNTRPSRVKLSYYSGVHYRDTFLPLVELERETDRQERSMLNIQETPVTWRGNYLTFPLFHKKSALLSKYKNKLAPGDVLTISPSGSSNSGGKSERSIPCSLKSISADSVVFCKPFGGLRQGENLVGKVEWVWPRTSYERCIDALYKIAKKPDMARSIYECLLGKVAEPPRRKKREQVDFSEVRGMNRFQKEALQSVVNSTVSLVQGPPGTGKTTLSAEIVEAWLRKARREKYGDRVLVCAPSNVAVNHIAARLIAKGVQVTRIFARLKDSEAKDIPPEILRVATHVRVAAIIAKNIRGKEHKYKAVIEIYRLCKQKSKSKYVVLHAFYTALMDFRFNSGYSRKRADGAAVRKLVAKAEKLVIDKTSVVLATCITSGRRVFEKGCFSYVLVDEAGQSTEPETIIPLMNGARQLVLVGDHYQLGPVIQERLVAKAGYTQSLFERLTRVGVRPNLLRIQYRMHPALAEFPNHAFYSGVLANGVTEKERTLDRLAGFFPNDNFPSLFRAVVGREEVAASGTSYLNAAEGKVVLEVVGELLRRGVRAEEIGIITPYDGQKKLLLDIIEENALLNRQELDSIEIASVDAFQGREKGVIIISCVRSNEFRNIGFLSDYRRMNVAITRAKYANIIVGNPHLLATNPLWKGLIGFYELKGLIVDEKNNPEEKRVTDYKELEEVYTEVKEFVESKRRSEKVGNSSEAYKKEGKSKRKMRGERIVRMMGRVMELTIIAAFGNSLKVSRIRKILKIAMLKLMTPALMESKIIQVRGK